MYFPPLSVKSSELQTIKTELTQIKSNIDALLGRLEQIAEEQKANPGQLPRVLAQISEQGHRAEHGEDDARGREGTVASDPTWTHLAEALVLPRCSLGRCPRLTFVLPSSSLSLKMAKRRARVAVAAAVVVAAAAAVLVAAAGHRPPQKTQLLRQARPREKHRLETMAMRRGC